MVRITAHRNRIKILAKSFTDEAILAASYAKHEKRPPSTAVTTTTTEGAVVDNGALIVAFHRQLIHPDIFRTRPHLT